MPTEPSAQLPLALGGRPAPRLQDFVDPPPGALDVLHAVATDPGADWVYVQGAAGLGKSHLLLATVALARQHGLSSVYLPVRKAAGQLDQALQLPELPTVAALDDVDAVAGSAVAERALFDFHNRMRDAGGTLVYAAAAAPAALPLGLPDLASRLGQCTRVVLAPLDDAGRARLLHLQARARGWTLDAAAVQWMLKHCPRDAASLLAALERLDRASLAAQRRITLPFLRTVLAER